MHNIGDVKGWVSPAVAVHFPVAAQDAGSRVGAFLRRQGVSLSLIRSLKYREDGILCNGYRVRTSWLLEQGDTVSLLLRESLPPSAAPQDLPLDIRYQSPHALVLNKPPGQMMHPVHGRRSDTLANAFCGLMARQGLSVPFRPIGRLDTDTSGLVLCALNGYAAPLLAQGARKAYLALVEGQLPNAAGWIEQPLAPQPGSAVRQQVAPGGRFSCTLYRVMASEKRASLVVVWPQTGRTHQIRAHFSHLGHPLLGDMLYGGGTTLLPRQALHCAALAFQEPQGNAQALEVPLPPDMESAAEHLGLPVPAGVLSIQPPPGPCRQAPI